MELLMKPGEELPSMTITPTVKGDATLPLRQQHNMDSKNTLFMYHPISNEIIAKYDPTIKNGDELIALWGNESKVAEHAGTILGEYREVEIDGVIRYIAPGDPGWHLEENELKT